MRVFGSERIRLFLSGPPASWELVDWNLRDNLLRWAAQRKHVDLYVERETLNALNADASNSLASLIDVTALTLYEVERFPDPRYHLACEVLRPNAVVRWAVESDDARSPGPTWGWAGADARFVRAAAGTPSDQNRGKAVRASELRRLPSDALVSLELIHELDGDIVGFGERFWSRVSAQVPALAARLRCRDSADCDHLRRPLPRQSACDAAAVGRVGVRAYSDRNTSPELWYHPDHRSARSESQLTAYQAPPRLAVKLGPGRGHGAAVRRIYAALPDQ